MGDLNAQLERVVLDAKLATFGWGREMIMGTCG
jgi:hypothetical protein